ncbi:MAG: hypothetical protein ABSE16_05860 [Verrucomicrobiota bacterium]|jgi:hypothetical protein
MTTRNGKIARLPRAVRDELNRRMDDGRTGKGLQTLARPPGIPAPREACGAVRPVYRRYRQDFNVTKAVAPIKAPPSSILYPPSPFRFATAAFALAANQKHSHEKTNDSYARTIEANRRNAQKSTGPKTANART